MSSTRIYSATVVSPPVSEPITLQQAKKQIEIGASDTNHDDHIELLIQTAREQWEHDTDSCVITQTLSVVTDDFDHDIYLPKRPIQSIEWIKYYDAGNTLQTLATSIYSLDAPFGAVRLKYNELWPVSIDRWDAVEIRYVAGYSDATQVPAIAKQAMLLLIGKYFENRDMMANDTMYTDAAYENLVRRFMRASYP